LSESLIVEHTDELSRPRIGYCGRDPTSKLAQNIRWWSRENGGSSQAHLTDNMPILKHASRAGAIPAKGEPLLRTA
jgi:hypothetical protein